MSAHRVTPPISSPSKHPLPLGWTQIKRKKRRKTDDDSKLDEDGEWCCEDPNCKIDINTGSKSTETNKEMCVDLEGTAVFCLHELDCKWFQGQFFVKSRNTRGKRLKQTKSFALLAKQRDDVDDCLACRDGGYKELDITVYMKSSSKNTERKSICLEKLVCTGGDMMKIQADGQQKFEYATGTSSSIQKGLVSLDFDADQVITGKKVETLVEKYFPSLIDRSTAESVTEQLPDCAIVIGTQKMVLPMDIFEEMNDNDSDGWLSE